METDRNARYPFSVVDVHLQRTGPYTTWPGYAVARGAHLPFLGAQVSFSGSLVRNLDTLEAAGFSAFAGWTVPWSTWSSRLTSGGNPRVDLVAFGEHHPLMPLIATEDVSAQIARHRALLADRIGAPPSRGIFPPENAVHLRMLPSLVEQGIEWMLVDNVHFDRTARGYPWNAGGNLVEPNPAEVRNPDPGDWVSLSGLWAPTPVSAGWGHRPHHVEWIDPDTAEKHRVVAVPTSRYLGNEDGRGGFGALDYEGVLSQLEPFNTDPEHPILVVLHHDGDNFGGGSESYYGTNFQAFVDWLEANPHRFEATTVQDHLDRFPPDPDDVIHVEPGSWSGADNGDPEFAKWLGDPDAAGVSPDRNSWAVLVAVGNRVRHARAALPGDPAVERARDLLLNGQASDYWYWDGSLDGVWDSQPTRAAELALAELGERLDGTVDLVGPEIFPPQREPYNPGGTEFGVVQDRVFEVWTLVDDHGGVSSVSLLVREDLDGTIDLGDVDNRLAAGGPGVGPWSEIPMVEVTLPPPTTDPLPSVRAARWTASVDVPAGTLLDYRVRATDTAGNVSWSCIEHVAVGHGTSSADRVRWSPANPGPDDVVEIVLEQVSRPARLHWGVDGWTSPAAAVWPEGTVLFGGTGPAVQSPFTIEGPVQVLRLGPFGGDTPGRLDFVLQYEDGGWEDDGGQDWVIAFEGGAPPPWTLDGAPEPDVQTLQGDDGTTLHVARQGDWLYLATDPASGTDTDVFLLVAGEEAPLVAAPWAKAGRTAAPVAYLGSESTNGWTGWFEAGSGAAFATGAVLEARIDLSEEFGGVVPGVVRVTALRYATADGGALVAQLPAGDGDADVEVGEMHAVTAVSTGAGSAAPAGPRGRITLHAPAPNPFNPRTTLRFELTRRAEVHLDLFDARGRRLARLESAVLEAGSHARVLDATPWASGVYFARLRALGESRVVRLVLVR